MRTSEDEENKCTQTAMLSHTALNKKHNSHSRRFKLPHGQKFYLKNEQKANMPPKRALCLFFKCQSENPPYPTTLKKIALINQLALVQLSFTTWLCHCNRQTNMTNVVCFLNSSKKIIYNFTLFLTHSLSLSSHTLLLRSACHQGMDGVVLRCVQTLITELISGYAKCVVNIIKCAYSVYGCFMPALWHFILFSFVGLKQEIFNFN